MTNYRRITIYIYFKSKINSVVYLSKLNAY